MATHYTASRADTESEAEGPKPLPLPPTLPNNNGNNGAAPRVRGRMAVFREELVSVLHAELAGVERDFEDEVTDLEARLKESESRLHEAQEENMRRAAELARLKLETSMDRQRREKDVHNLNQAWRTAQAELETTKKANHELNDHLMKLQTQFHEKATSLERMEREFNEVLFQREREVKELTATNERFERKLNALMEVQRRLEEALRGS